jgi:hypothetical protein
LTGAVITISPGTLQAGDTLNYPGGSIIIINPITPWPIWAYTGTLSTPTASSTSSSAGGIIIEPPIGWPPILNFSPITGSYNAATGTLTLSGTASVAQYEQALREITFSTTSTSTAARSISIVVQDGTLSSTTVTETINVSSIHPHRPPVAVQQVVVVASGMTSTYTVGGSAVHVDSGVLVASADENMTGATVTISTGTLQAGDTLNFTNQNGITGTFADGVLTLTGNATAAQYETALQSITFSTTSSSTVSRSISIVATDGSATSKPASECVEIIGGQSNAPVPRQRFEPILRYSPGGNPFAPPGGFFFGPVLAFAPVLTSPGSPGLFYNVGLALGVQESGLSQLIASPAASGSVGTLPLSTASSVVSTSSSAATTPASPSDDSTDSPTTDDQIAATDDAVSDFDLADLYV